MPPPQGLQLDRVVLLGRTYDEYVRFFGLTEKAMRGLKILDAAAGVSSFTAEARQRGLNATAFDRIYEMPAGAIEKQSSRDLDEVARNIGDKSVYRWGFYKSPQGMRSYRARAAETFLKDFQSHSQHYVPGSLPSAPFADGQFDLTLVSYLLFVYEDQLTFDFHKQSLRELLRVSREIRIYPTVTFEAHPSTFLDLLRNDADFRDCSFVEVTTDFEFLRNSNRFLKVTRHAPPAARHYRASRSITSAFPAEGGCLGL